MTPTEYIDKIGAASFEELTNVVDILLTMDTTNLDAEVARTPRVFTDLYRLLNVQTKRLKEVMRVHDELMIKRRRYYGGKATAAEYKAEPLNLTLMKTEIESHIDVDEKVAIARGYLADADMKVKFIEDSIKVAKSRGFDIKNSLAWKQLTSS